MSADLAADKVNKEVCECCVITVQLCCNYAVERAHFNRILGSTVLYDNVQLVTWPRSEYCSLLSEVQ